jgi:glutamine amidotransferase
VSEVTVLAYGAGNTASVRFALERLGATVRLTADPAGVASPLINGWSAG